MPATASQLLSDRVNVSQVTLYRLFINRLPITYTVIVPVRLSKKAVERNRTRRLLREAIHQHLAHLEHGYEVIVMARKILKDEKLTDILSDTTESLQNAGLLK